MRTSHTIYLTKVRTPYGKQAACQLIDSLRTFGGDLEGTSFWLFETDPLHAPCQDLTDEFVEVIPLEVPSSILNYDLGDKVFACARAEELAPPGTEALVWIDPLCLVVNPPDLYRLTNDCDATLRPVHIRNVGSLASEPPDAYWKRVYQAVGVEDNHTPVESFVDQEQIRAYYNTHAFAIRPALGLLQRWLECFAGLVCDPAFQAGPCQDELHQLFLHQAVFSALIAATIPENRVRRLPPEYNYPYTLHGLLSPERRARALNDLVSFTYEDRSLDPAKMEDIEIREPLRAWLEKYAREQ